MVEAITQEIREQVQRRIQEGSRAQQQLAETKNRLSSAEVARSIKTKSQLIQLRGALGQVESARGQMQSDIEKLKEISKLPTTEEIDDEIGRQISGQEGK